MKKLLNKFITYLKSVFLKPPKAPRKRKYKTRKDKQIIGGQYTTIKELLSDLDETFRRIKYLTRERHNSEFQRVIKRFGPYVININGHSDDYLLNGTLEGFKAYGLPSFLVSYHNVAYVNRTKKGDDKIVHSFMTAIKSKRAAFGQRRKDHVYYDVALTIVDDGEKGFERKPLDLVHCIEVNKHSGIVNALPHNHIRVEWVKNKKNGQPDHRIPVKVCEYPDLLPDHYTVHDQQTCREWLITSFYMHYNFVMRRESGINIIVKKGKNRATFSVPHNDWKYFFKDRIKAKTTNGSTRPIYHAVASHFREVKGGVTAVKTHYRGARHFFWKGYEIKIVLQGKHAISQADFDVTAEDSEMPIDNPVLITGKKMANTLNNLFEGKQ